MATATHDDVNLILRLFELRRDEKMRRARDWFFSRYKGVTAVAQHMQLCPPASEEDAYFRMVVSYWDMVASFMTSGVLNRELFFESGREMLIVWVRIEPVVPEVRTALKDPYAFSNLERIAREYLNWLDTRSPGHSEIWRGLVAG
jgi:hypothetical protein